MIIKSKPRKTHSFRQLIDYFHKEVGQTDGVLTHNLIGQDRESIAEQFEDNARFLHRRANGNVLYHEFLSLPEHPDIPVARQVAMLHDIARVYLRKRAPKCLAYANTHRDTQHIHMHVLISANNIHERSRHWLTRSQFDEIKKEVERYRLQTYPELGDDFVIDKSKQRDQERSKPQLTHGEFEYKRRTGQLSRKERDHWQLKQVFHEARDEKALIAELQREGFELYQRGQLEGVIAQDGRKYRLRTLGLEANYLTAKNRMRLFSQRQQELDQHVHHSLEPNRERS